jgi:hypothetical protein
MEWVGGRTFVSAAASQTEGLTILLLMMVDSLFYWRPLSLFPFSMSSYDADELIRLYQALSPSQQKQVSAYLDQQTGGVGRKRMVGAREGLPRVSGRLVFDRNRDRPLHHVYVELWDRDVFTPDDFLGAGWTDADGQFEISYDPEDAGFRDKPDLELRVFEMDHTFDREGDLKEEPKLIYTRKGPDNFQGSHYAFGDIPIPYWEYDPNAVSPRVLVPDFGDPPHAFSRGRVLAMMASVAPLEEQKRKHMLRSKLNPKKPGLDEVQGSYPSCKTQEMEEAEPGSSRSDAYFGERFLNGMLAANLDRDPRDPDCYWFYIQWNAYEQDGIHCLPNVDIRFRLDGETLLPVRIALAMREPGVTEAHAPTETLEFFPEDGARWEQAKRVARVAATLWAELDAHLINTHLNTEQYAIAFYRNIRRNPLKVLLGPHLKEVVYINYRANEMLLGERGFITRASALTDGAIEERIRQAMGMLNWEHWTPREPICEEHQYAKSAWIYWDALGQYIDRFFEEHAGAIRENWVEVHRFSNDLVEHANPFYMCSYLLRTLKQDDSWFNKNERPDLPEGAGVTGNTLPAVSPITRGDSPAEGDWEHLKQACRYIIMHATFMHSWANDRQQEDAGEILYAGLGMRYGERGVFVPESDWSVAPTPVHASEQLWFANFLSNTRFGFIMRNEDHDIPPLFLQVLKSVKPQLDALGFDLNDLQSRTNI